MKNRTVIGIICIAAALVFAFGAVPLINAVSEGKTEAAVAVTDTDKGHLITEAGIEMKTVHSSDLPPDAVTDPSQIIGKYASCDIKAGAVIMSSMCSSSGISADTVLSSLDGSRQAVSITLDSFASGLSGKLEGGDIVSAVVSDGGTASIPKELKYLKVIAVTFSSGRDTDDDMPDDENYSPPVTATLLANAVQSRMLAQYEHGGYIHLCLVYRGSAENADAFLAAQDEVFSGGTE